MPVQMVVRYALTPLSWMATRTSGRSLRDTSPSIFSARRQPHLGGNHQLPVWFHRIEGIEE